MVKPMHSRRREALAPATVEAIEGLATLNDALERARHKYQETFLTQRPPNAITVREFMAHYNAMAAKTKMPPIAQRTAENMFLKWCQKGEYQRASILIVSKDTRPRRTYVYWQTKK